MSLPYQAPSEESSLRLRRLAGPLALVFLGAVFVLIDLRLGLRIGDRAGGFDVFPDAVGLVLLAVGTGRLAFGGELRGGADWIMTVVWGVVTAFALGSMISWLDPEIAALEGWVRVVLALVGAGAVVGFCLAMHALSRDLGLERFASEWALVAVLFLVCCSVPDLAAVLFPALAGKPVLAILLPLLRWVPLAFLFSVLRRMRNQAEAVASSGRSSRGAF